MHRACSEKDKLKMKSPLSGSTYTHSKETNHTPVANHLYLAPQATVRQTDRSLPEKKRLPQSSSGATRRRRYKSRRQSGARRVQEYDQFGIPVMNNWVGQDDDFSDSSNDSYEYTLEAPLLWVDDDEEACASLTSRGRSTGQRHRRYKRRHHRDAGSVHSHGNNDEESVYTYLSNQSSRKGERERTPNRLAKCRKVCGKFLLKGDIFCSFRTRYRPIFQIVLFSSLMFLVWDARQKLSDHKSQLRHLEEEREHILHQMTWIDNEAKKAHEHYSSPKLDNGDPHQSSSLTNDREELDRVQLRIQQNARDVIDERFGGGAMVISLPLRIDGEVTVNSRLSISLSGDAPHAVSTLTQQVSSADSVWKSLSIQRLVSDDECSVVAIQAKTDDTNILPVLEFVEQTRGCHEAGAVSLHPLESPGEEAQRLMLKVRLAGSSTKRHTGDVCIGHVVEGLEDLDALLPNLPVFHVDDVNNY